MDYKIPGAEVNKLLKRIKTADDRVVEAQTTLTAAVQTAREVGATWLDIGMALGISRQAAHQRFGALREEQ